MTVDILGRVGLYYVFTICVARIAATTFSYICMLNPAFGCQTSTTYRPGATRRYAPADGSSTRGGSTSVRGQVRSPRISGGRRWLCCRQPACLQPRPLRHGTDRRYRLQPPTVGIINLYVVLYCIVRTAARRCVQHKAPQYTTDYYIHTSDTARRQHLPGGR